MYDTWISGSDVNSFCHYGVVYLPDSWLCLRSLIEGHLHFTFTRQPRTFRDMVMNRAPHLLPGFTMLRTSTLALGVTWMGLATLENT